MGEESCFRRVNSFTLVFLLVFAACMGLFVILPVNVNGVNHSGSTTQNTIWTAGSNPHRITGDFTVSAGHTLVLEDGVNVYFMDNTNLIVNGKLYANGTVSTGLTFQRSGSATADWESIKFNTGSSGILKNCDIQEGSVAALKPVIHINTNEKVLVENCTIYNSDNMGIYIERGSHKIINCSVDGCTVGITNYRGNSTIENNTVINCQKGLELSGGAPRVIENTVDTTTTTIGIIVTTTGAPEIAFNNVSNCTSGIEVSGSTAVIHDNVIYLCQKGAYLKSDTNFTFYNNTLNSCQDSFYTEKNAFIENCTIINSTRYNFNLKNANNHNIYTLNTAYNNTNSIDIGCNLHKQWSIHAYVKDNFNAPVGSANVAFKDQATNTVMYQTKPDGWLRWLRATEQVFLGSSTPTPKTPHTVTASKTGYNATIKTPDLNKQQTLIFSIKDTQPPISTVDAIYYWYNTTRVNLTYSATDNVQLKNITLFYNYSTDNNTFSVLKKSNSTTLSGINSAGWFIFEFTNGEGYYKFLTKSFDKTNNPEIVPLMPDVIIGHDKSKPEFVGWKNTDINEDSTMAICTVNVTISDAYSGLGNQLPTISYKYDSSVSSWDGSNQKMSRSSTSRSIGNARSEQNEYYFNITAPSGGWDSYQNKYLAFQVKCHDLAGNIALSPVQFELIDYINHAPSIQLAQPVQDKWYNGTIQLRTIPSDQDDYGDPISEWGIAGVYGEYSTNSSTGPWLDCTDEPVTQEPFNLYWNTSGVIELDSRVWVRARAQDNGGLYSNWAMVRIMVDNMPGNTSADYPIAWQNADFYVNLTAEDGSGSGIKDIWYRINGDENISTNSVGLPLIQREGDDNTLEYWSIDNQDNSEKSQFIYGLRLDKTDPLLDDLQITDISQGTKIDDEVAVLVNASDLLSGLKSLPQIRFKFPNELEYSSWQEMTLVEEKQYKTVISLPLGKTWADFQGEKLSVQVRCTDLAENQVTKTIDELIDKTTPPEIVHTPVTVAFVNQDITINAVVTDDQKVMEVRLYYKPVDGSSFISLVMLPESGLDNVYSRKIPGQEKPGKLYYYINASDKAFTVSAPALDPLSNPYLVNVIYEDTDGDNLPDFWEIQHFGSIINYSGSSDPDGDGLTNKEEFDAGTDPNKADTDGDGLPDAWEVRYGLNPHSGAGDDGPDGDPDKDGYTNLEEYKGGSNPIDKEDTPKKETGKTDLNGLYIGIIVIVIVIILLMIFMFYRSRSFAAGGGSRGMDELGKPKVIGEIRTLKPAVTTLATQHRMEFITLDKGMPCGACMGPMANGSSAFRCTCGLTIHSDCAVLSKTCPQCGADYDLSLQGFEDAGKRASAAAVAKPVIRKETKREIEELVRPERAYFTYVPKSTNDNNIKKFLDNYYNNYSMGASEMNEELKDIDLFLAKNAATKMLDHCYHHGREKEVLGLMLGETYIYNDKVFSIVKDVVTSELDATEVSVKFDSFENMFAELEKLEYDYQIIGWYHSHPSYTSFMSPQDVATQKKMFKLSYQRAIVIDPIKFDMKGFALNQDNKDKVHKSGFAIIDFRD